MKRAWLLTAFAATHEVLELDVRRRLHAHLHKFPGLHLRELARALELEANHAKYHLDRLERHGLITSRKEEGYWRFWPCDEGRRERIDRRDKKAVALLRKKVPLHIVTLLLEHDRLSQVGLLEHVGVAQSTLHYHLRNLEQVGLISSSKPSRERWYMLEDADHVEKLLSTYRPPDHLVQGFLDVWEQLELVQQGSKERKGKKEREKKTRRP